MSVPEAFARPADSAGRRIWRTDGPTGLPVPRYDGRSIVNLAVSAFAASGARGRRGPMLAPPLEESVDPFSDTTDGTRLVFLVDALGWDGFLEWSRAAGPTGTTWARSAVPLTTVFPSTTTAALVSLSTGVPPGRHGLVGYRQYLPRFGVVGDMLNMAPVGTGARDQLIGPGWTPSMLTGAPTLARRGMRTTVLTRDIFEGSGLTRLLYDGAEFVGYATASHLVHQLVGILGRPRPPRVLYLYWSELDTVQHLVGPDPRWFAMEVDRIADLLRRAASQLPRVRTRAVRVAITGDHGQVPATVRGRVSVDEERALLREMVRPLAGDRRAGFFAVRPGRAAALERALRRRMAPRTPVHGTEEILRAELFGPPPFHPEIRERIGDVVAFPRSPECFTYRLPGAAAPKRFLTGAHGGLEAEELLVPLVAGSLADLTDDAGRSGASKR
ncbi:MAG: alkaline phosphatase family protein [Thermoplasmata archaeon]|nr:alkaline phosphatase family protein [Thermoplasmata archaeon]